LVVFFSAAPVLAMSPKKEPELPKQSALPVSDSSGSTPQGSSLQKTADITGLKVAGKSVEASGSPPSAAKKDSVIIPEGFVVRKLRKGESLSKICENDSVCQVIFMKVNRVDQRHFPVGKRVLLPVEREKAEKYVPIPTTLTDSRGEREIRIYLSSQYFGAYEKGVLVFWGAVSTGKRTNATPPGKFVVNYKQRFKKSIKYDNAPMPYSINYNGGYFMHQQSLPGYPASHGCVRLLMSDAERLFTWAKLKDPVTVVRNGK
jgi:lipoprotein-anchoring transpeptidase ErfK/SrfK